MSYAKIISGISITILVCIIVGMIIISMLMSYQMFDNIKRVKSVVPNRDSKQTSMNPLIPSLLTFLGGSR